MWKISDYWNACEKHGFIRSDLPGKTVYRPPSSVGAGSIEIWGMDAEVTVCVMDFMLRQQWNTLERADEQFLQLSQFYTGPAEAPRDSAEMIPSDRGLCCSVNFPPSSAYKQIRPGKRFVDVSLICRASFVDHLPIAVPVDFWENAARVFNPAPVRIPAVTAVFDRVRACTLEGDALNLFLQGVAMEVLALTASFVEQRRTVPSVHLTAEDRSLLNRVRERLCEQLAEPPSISDLAAATGLNQQKLMTGFRSLYNTTIYGYLKLLRMKRAAELLQDTDLPVMDIAQSVGYHGDGHFQNAFKDVYGITPHRLRKETR